MNKFVVPSVFRAKQPSSKEMHQMYCEYRRTYNRYIGKMLAQELAECVGVKQVGQCNTG